MTNKEIIENINNRIIEKLESGVNPWHKPWKCDCDGNRIYTPEAFAINYLTNKAYSGINQCLLEPGYYLTFKQIQELGGRINKGAKAQQIVFTKPILIKVKSEEDEDGTKETTEEEFRSINMLKLYAVFRLEDTTGCRVIKHRTSVSVEKSLTVQEIDYLINEYVTRTDLTFTSKFSNKAFYRPFDDSVTVPLPSQFEHTSEYYSTVFHELGHSTGASKRLNRSTLTATANFGSQIYSKEELVAEITACYSLGYLNIEDNSSFSNSVAYLKSWASHIKESNYSIMSATAQAEKAFNLIFNI